MIIRFTNARPTEIFHFMDGTKRNLRLVACSFLNGYEFVNETILQVVFHLSSNKIIRKMGSDKLKDELKFASYKEGLPSRAASDIYFNKNYQIPKDCDMVSLKIMSPKEFEIDCILLLD